MQTFLFSLHLSAAHIQQLFYNINIFIFCTVPNGFCLFSITIRLNDLLVHQTVVALLAEGETAFTVYYIDPCVMFSMYTRPPRRSERFQVGYGTSGTTVDSIAMIILCYSYGDEQQLEAAKQEILWLCSHIKLQCDVNPTEKPAGTTTCVMFQLCIKMIFILLMWFIYYV